MAVTVLLVDDSADFRFLLRKRLEQIGCRIVAEAADSESGLELFRAYRPQLVTLDLMMPDSPKFTSKELFRAIRNEAPQTAVLVISTQSRSSNASSFLAAGATAFFEKSFMNFDEVRKKLQAIFPEIKSY
jgi:two-component system, chemotaxis family, chemotaxis protein CheY